MSTRLRCVALALLAACVLLYPVPAHAAEYIYSNGERARLERLAEDLEHKAEEAIAQAEALIRGPRPVSDAVLMGHVGLAKGYLDAADQVRHEAQQLKRPARPHPWRRDRNTEVRHAR
jgi:hypothetical protein